MNVTRPKLKPENDIQYLFDNHNYHDQGQAAWNALTAVATVVTSGASYAMSRNQTFLVVNKTVGSATAVTLPATPISGQFVIVKDGKGDASSNNITVAAASGNIDGAANKVINADYGVMQFGYNGTQWNVLSAS